MFCSNALCVIVFPVKYSELEIGNIRQRSSFLVKRTSALNVFKSRELQFCLQQCAICQRTQMKTDVPEIDRPRVRALGRSSVESRNETIEELRGLNNSLAGLIPGRPLSNSLSVTTCKYRPGKEVGTATLSGAHCHAPCVDLL